MSTLIEQMVTVAMIGAASAAAMQQFHHVEQANSRAVAVESVTRALDQEMERFRACETRACAEDLANRSVEERSREVYSWTGVELQRAIEDGPSGTLKVTLKASVPGSRLERKLVALVWVAK